MQNLNLNTDLAEVGSPAEEAAIEQTVIRQKGGHEEGDVSEEESPLPNKEREESGTAIRLQAEEFNYLLPLQ